MNRKRILFIGDAACPSGFARATHAIIEHLDYRQMGEHEVTVLGINYRGDPNEYPYPIYTAAAGGDWMGVGRLAWMCVAVRPDLIIIQQDGWHMPSYVNRLRAMEEFKDVPILAIVAVDGKNFCGKWLDGVTAAVFWTEFALTEARAGGYEGPAQVIPLGVDTDVYYPIDKQEARRLRFSEAADELMDKFIVGNVNRNQFRKRWDLTIRYFAEWVRSYKIPNAQLFLHCAPTGDDGVNVKQLSAYYGVFDKLALMEPLVHYGISEEDMRLTYNCFDVQVTTTQGEGFGLTTFEGMACGVPQIVPQWSALEELTHDAAIQVPCTSTVVGPPFVNVIGGVPDEEKFIQALNRLYSFRSERERFAAKGFARAVEERFRWENVGKTYAKLVSKLLVRSAQGDAVSAQG